MLLSQLATRKMKADYFRYLAEFAKDDAKREHAANAEGAYKQATESASSLAPTHPIRLGLALNFSVFLYEVQGEQKAACDFAKSAFDDGIAEVETLDEVCTHATALQWLPTTAHAPLGRARTCRCTTPSTHRSICAE